MGYTCCVVFSRSWQPVTRFDEPNLSTYNLPFWFFFVPQSHALLGGTRDSNLIEVVNDRLFSLRVFKVRRFLVVFPNVFIPARVIDIVWSTQLHSFHGVQTLAAIGLPIRNAVLSIYPYLSKHFFEWRLIIFAAVSVVKGRWDKSAWLTVLSEVWLIIFAGK